MEKEITSDMFKKIARVFTGDPHKKRIDALVGIVDQINALESNFEKLSDSQLRGKTDEFRSRLAGGETLDQLLPEAFATVREASKRILGQRHYDVQLICGINLHQGAISELRTGEGKTLSATLPLYLNALEGKGTHLVTVNDYLARRDGRWMGAIYHMLGMQVGILQMANTSDGNQRAYLFDPEEHSLKEETNLLRPVDRRQAYLADITYGTNSEFGFDYLRDNITMNLNQRVQRGHHYAIIDEVDNILIDEARTPLIISGPSHEDSETYIRMAQVARSLNPEDYEVDEKDRTVSLTEAGIAHVEELLGEPLSDPERPEDISPEQARLMGFLEQSLRAQFLFHRNKEYIVQGGEVIIVDEFTGRMMPGRRWSDGLHQAVEAKEGVKVQAENITHATITIQNYFRMYHKLAGMTGTALTEQEEFFRIYGLDVLPIPTNLEYQAMRADSGLIEAQDKDEEGYAYTFYTSPADPLKKPLYFKRKDYPDVIYRTREGKLRAMALEIVRYHAIGRPQLVGTTSVESSEQLSERLSADMIRRLLQTAMIRQAWLKSRGVKEEDFATSPELAVLNEPLDKLRMPELRRLGSQFGLTSMDPGDESNRALVLRILRLEEPHWPRVQPLFESGVPHQVLNARKHTEESLIIAKAGAFGAVTIATNMAGRGVDIKLGGELPENMLAEVNQVLARVGGRDPYNMTMSERLDAVRQLPEGLSDEDQLAVQGFVEYMENMAKVRALGGLHVIGTERHEARRIDNQLRGRAARQGDPGSSRFYLSLEDDLMRMFGGAQVESLLTRFKIDENLPIEMGVISRVVEQSQTRVEGANFDVRKHLLEYDDVLNAQRQRIYAQRDRIFSKDDLHEDVREMLATELGERVRASLASKEGLWKLLAYLEEVQPEIDTQWGAYPTFSQRLALEALGEPANEQDLRQKLLDLAQQAHAAEKAHLLGSVNEMLSKAEQALKTQTAERSDALDAYIDTFDPQQPHDLQTELSQIVQMPLRLTPAQQRAFIEDPYSQKETLREALRTGISLSLARRILLTLERRFNESWPVKAADLASLPWAEMSAQIRGQVEAILNRRTERLLGAGGEIERDLDGNASVMAEAVMDEEARLRLLQLMTQGRQVAFDARSHRKFLRQQSRLSYIFSMGAQLEKKNPDLIAGKILSHLNGAEEALQAIFGEADWEHLVNNHFQLASLPEDTRTKLEEALGAEVYASLSTQPLEEIPEDLQLRIRSVLGERSQNRIYRQLLLGTITESWVEYLTRMEALRVSISMESYAQRDPLVQYKSQASTMFTELLSEVRQTVISRMFRYRPSSAVESRNALKSQSAGEPAAVGQSRDQSQAEGALKKRRKRH